ncbi:outer envelope pore protein 16, chloroplastic-like [Panicum hallii]|uniref:outer envelope pore protein 16, chloroplastic-like n=1 Tax=Panicum hallii TaxID=206008 RepID=UPI000DF4D89A|nr:outer envelope pore protein 16, chloroplastic-like [Panicum hallii]
MSKITAAESFEAEVVWLGLPRRNTIAVSIEMDRPVLSRTLHGFLLPHRAVRSFLNVGAAAACKVAAEDALDCLTTGCVSRHKVECSLKKICKDGAYWGTAAGVYVAMESAVEETRGRTDWKNAVIGGALAGAVMSAATAGSSGHRDKVVKDAIAGAAIAAAAEFIGHRVRVDLGPVRFAGGTRSRSNQTKEGRNGAEPGERQEVVAPWVAGREVELPLQFRTDPALS